MKDSDLKNGVRMIAYCREHEAYLDARLAAGENPAKLLEWHKTKLAWIQHERLIHLLVTILTAGAFLFALGAWLATQSLAALLFTLALLVLLACYLFHYFRLENTVQHWYRIADRLRAAADRESEGVRK